MRSTSFWCLCALAICAVPAVLAGDFLIGSGVYDNTGEIVEGGFMGYAMLNQRGTGLHFRTRSRAFVVVDQATGKRVAYVSSDLCMAMQMMKLQVIENLQKQFGNTYTFDNVIMTGTHTHAAPGGFGGTALHDITTLGFIKGNFEAGVNGIVGAIARAHANIKPGRISYATGQLDKASINRSPASYLRDPVNERAQYPFETDHDFTTLKFIQDDGTEIGAASFFAVHPVSMNNTNTLVSGDNKGYASLLFELQKNPTALPGKGKFVAAFGNSNEGDVSPNTKGPKCPDGSDCNFEHSTCGGFTQGCIASGPGKDMWESTEIIGRMQFEKAAELYEKANVRVFGGVDYRHQYVDFRNVTVEPQYNPTGKREQTCIPALGYSFAAGTVDGPGEFDFIQGSNNSNPFWDFVSAFLAKPTPEQKACQAPKPILLDVGLTVPLPWVPYILPLQVARIGQLWIVAVPAEFTTMAGRRLRNLIRNRLQQLGKWQPDSLVLLAGLANSYSHYVTTFEEYQQQRYEGASTLYGAHTLGAHSQIVDGLLTAIVNNQSVAPGPTPIDMRNRTFSFILPPPADAVPAGKKFGDVNVDAKDSYALGETVKVSFWGANPRHDLRTEQSYLTVERHNGTAFVPVLDDGNWETKYHWARPAGSFDQSIVTVEWNIAKTSQPGNYRIQTFGSSMDSSKTKRPYSGASRTFVVRP